MKKEKTSLANLHDAELLSSTKNLVAREREITTHVLQHLAEIERRKLYCDISRAGNPDLKYGSLFEYAVHELGYSEAAASRRIQAMRLVKEMPEIEAKIQSGALTLSNISQAQVFFREIKRAEPTRVVSRAEKASVLEKLEQKSAREAERVLITLSPVAALPKDRVRQIDLEHTELRFTVDAELKAQLQRVRSLLGPRGGLMGLAELVSEMAKLSEQRLVEQKFGKRRARAEATSCDGISSDIEAKATSDVGSRMEGNTRTESQCETLFRLNSDVGTVAKYSRYVPQAVKHAVWRSARGQCTSCGSTNNLQFDHIQPVALGGRSTPDNLQLLCGSCNLRRGVKTFGTTSMKRV